MHGSFMNEGMRTSKSGLEFIAKWEGLILTPYLDIASLWTIGVGHLIKPTDSFSAITNEQVKQLLATKDKNHPLAKLSITKEEALNILAKDIALTEQSLLQNASVQLSQNQFDAMISFGFNCGPGVFKNSGVFKALNVGHYADVPARLLDWSKARINGELKVSKGLLARRTAEGQLFSQSSIPTLTSTTLISWTPEIIADVQKKLNKLGLYTDVVDGIAGPNTRKAMEKFSKSIGIEHPKSGVSSDWLNALNRATQ